MKNIQNFCDLLCKFAQLPREEGLDGSGSCRTFLALYCTEKKMIVAKNLPCNLKVLKTKGKDLEKGNSIARNRQKVKKKVSI